MWGAKEKHTGEKPYEVHFPPQARNEPIIYPTELMSLHIQIRINMGENAFKVHTGQNPYDLHKGDQLCSLMRHICGKTQDTLK